MSGLAAGDRLRCTTCGTEIILVKPPGGPIGCCGLEMAPLGDKDGASTAATAKEGPADGQ